MLRNDDYWMRLAIRMAKFGERHGEVPVGALAVDEKQVLLAASFNQTIAACNPIMHAEMIVIQQVAKKLKQIRLKEITLYVTLEPCPMCAGAIREARLKGLYSLHVIPRWGLQARSLIVSIIQTQIII